MEGGYGVKQWREPGTVRILYFRGSCDDNITGNYYKWMFLLLSDVDEVKDEHYEEKFRMEYECGDGDTGEMSGDLIDYQEANCRLPREVEIYYDEKESDKRQLFKVAIGAEEIELIREKEREELEALIHSVRKEHEKLIVKMREKVKYIREIKKGNGGTQRMSDDEIKKLVSVEKRMLIQFRKEDNRDNGCNLPEQKKRKTNNDHKSRCSDLKVQFFQKTKEMLDKEETEGLIASWERVYKQVMNKYVKEKTKEVEPVLREPSKMLNELSKAVDLEELMNEEQNLQGTWSVII